MEKVSFHLWIQWNQLLVSNLTTTTTRDYNTTAVRWWCCDTFITVSLACTGFCRRLCKKGISIEIFFSSLKQSFRYPQLCNTCKHTHTILVENPVIKHLWFRINYLQDQFPLFVKFPNGRSLQAEAEHNKTTLRSLSALFWHNSPLLLKGTHCFHKCIFYLIIRYSYSYSQ